MKSTGSKKNLALNESIDARKAMVEKENTELPIKRQAELLSVNRTSVYRPAKEQNENEKNIRLMNQMDEIYRKHPYYGYRRITRILRNRGAEVNRKRVRRLMQVMGLEAIYPKPNLSKRLHAFYTHPYLLRGLTIKRPNQVWGIDITYLRMEKGLMYLFLIIDWYSRKVINYELSSTLEKDFVLRCLKRAFRCCKPEIMNSDQGSPFTNRAYLELLEKEGIKVSMDGKGRATDNSRTERFFRSLKYECVYINEFVNPRSLRQGIARYVQFYNEERPHHSLEGANPLQFYTHKVKPISF